MIASVSWHMPTQPDTRAAALGLALSDGGAKALAQLGVLRILEREAIPIGCVAGSSAGALIGAVLATSRDVQETEERIVAYLHTPGPGFNAETLTPLAVHATQRNAGFRGVWRSWRDRRRVAGLIQGEALRESLDRLFAGRTFADTKFPLAAIALDLIAGKRVILRSGSLADATYASSAVPGLLEPFRLDGTLLADGGWVEPVPVDPCRELGAPWVLAVVPRGSELEATSADRIWTLIRADQAARRSLAKAQASRAQLALWFRVSAKHFGDFSDVPGLIAAGEAAALAELPRIVGAIERAVPSRSSCGVQPAFT